MYKYEYVTLSCEVGDWGFGSGLIYELEDYRAEIEKRAANGWRYVGCIPTKQSGFIQGTHGRKSRRLPN